MYTSFVGQRSIDETRIAFPFFYFHEINERISELTEKRVLVIWRLLKTIFQSSVDRFYKTRSPLFRQDILLDEFMTFIIAMQT
jgi:hypothetical protein